MAITTRKGWPARAGTLAGAAIIGALAVWVSGFRPDLFHTANDANTPQPPAARLSTPTGPARAILPTNAEVQTALPGGDSSLSKEPQPLILTGTIVGRNLNEGSAFIGISGSNPQTYSGGAILANGARLKEIGHDYVILERGGRSVKLYAQNTKPGRDAGRATDALLTVGGRPASAPAQPTDSDPITDFIRPTPLFDGDVMVGYQVYAGAHSGTFARLGLQNGDIITSIDGAPLTDGLVALESLRPLTRGASIAVNVKRNGASSRVVLDGSIVAAELHRKTADATPIAGAPGT
jgi:general secretion pathway protein C